MAVCVAVLITIGVGKEMNPHNTTDPAGDNASRNKAEIGSMMTFGSYEQDCDTADGKEPIQWIILADDGAKLTLMSLRGLDAVPYGTAKQATTWETSNIRTWLNDTFYNTAFSEEEQARLVNTSLSNTPNPTHGTDGGNATEDFVYLLSIDEYNNLLIYTGNEACSPTKYAVSQGVKAETDNGRELCSWWLRTPGYDPTKAAAYYITNENFSGYSVTTKTTAVRPVITLTK